MNASEEDRESFILKMLCSDVYSTPMYFRELNMVTQNE